MSIIKFFHHLFNPHCQDCRVDSECKNCQVLRELLESERYNNKQILTNLLEQLNPKEQPQPSKTPEPVGPGMIPWRVRQQMLEENDRRTAQIKRQQSAEIAELEKKVGLDTIQSLGE